MKRSNFNTTRIFTLAFAVVLFAGGLVQLSAKAGYFYGSMSATDFIDQLFSSNAVIAAENAPVNDGDAPLDTVTWDGDPLINNSNWTNGGNWTGGNASANDDLIFPQNALRKTNINDFGVNTNFNSITFTGSGYNISGAQIFLGIGGFDVNIPGSADGPDFDPNIILGANQPWNLQTSFSNITGVVNLNNRNLTVNATGGNLTMQGTISGTGTITKAGGGFLRISGDANGFGTTTLNQGSLDVTTGGSLGNILFGGAGTLTGEGTVGSISGGFGGTISPGDAGGIGILTATGNATLIGVGGNTVEIRIDGPTVGTEYDRLVVNGDVTLGGDVTLDATLVGFTPVVGQTFTIVQTTGGAGNTITGQFNQGTSIVISGRPFSITYLSTAIVLTALPATSIWDGSVTNLWNNSANWVSNTVPIANVGDELLFPAAQRIINQNNFTAGSSFRSITFTSNGYQITGSSLTLTHGVTDNSPVGDRNNLNIDLTLAQAQTFTGNGVGNVATSGFGIAYNNSTINLNGFPLTIAGTGRQNFQSTITGAGGLIKNGTGGANLAGTNTFTGIMLINNGTLTVSGTTSQQVLLGSGTIGGSGTVGSIFGAGTIAPGGLPATSTSVFAILNANGTVTLDPSSNLAIQIGGTTAGTEYDRLNVTGDVNIGGTTNLVGTLLNGFTPSPGQQFTIIQSTGNFTGQFAQGSTIVIGGTTFNITYNSNSVVLSVPGGTPTPTPTATPLITGTITYGNAIGVPSPRFVSNVLISGAGSPNVSTVTGAPGAGEGTYSLSGFGAGAYTVTPTKTGGVNGAISSFDAGRIALHVAGLPNPQLSGNQLIVADVSGNGSISSFDAGQIARFVVTVAGSGSTGNWIFSPVSRNYASITADFTGQDYSALLMGEVSGNWNNTGARPANSGGPERNVAVSAPRLVTPADKEVIIPVSVEDVAEKGIISYEFDLRYDPSVIQPEKDPVELAGTVSDRLSFAVNAEEPGLLRVAVYGATQIDSDGVLLNLKFTTVGAPGSISPLDWERLMFNEGDPQALAADGQVELSAAASNDAVITGRLLTAFGAGVPNTRVTLTDTTGKSRSVVSNGFGAYRFGKLQSGQTYTISVESRRYRFMPLTVSVTDQLISVDLIAEE